MMNLTYIAGERNRRIRMVNPRDIAGNAEEEEAEGEEWRTPSYTRYSWERKRKRRMVNPGDLAGERRIIIIIVNPRDITREHRRGRRRMNPRDTAGNAEEEKW